MDRPPGLRSVLAVAALAASLYAHPKMLDGEFVYDDGGTITGNPVTLCEVPFSEVWKRDYWGKDPIDSKASHKSYRPITSISFRLNYQHSKRHFGGQLRSRGFHIVNVALHVAVSLLCLPTTYLAFGGGRVVGAGRAATFTALLFAAHPIHSEAVQNITGRAELLMAFSFLLGFVGYACATMAEAKTAYESWREKSSTGSHTRELRIYPSGSVWLALLGTVPFCTLLALLSKEMGATLPMLCSFWDFFVVERLALPHLLLWPSRSQWTHQEPQQQQQQQSAETSAKSPSPAVALSELSAWMTTEMEGKVQGDGCGNPLKTKDTSDVEVPRSRNVHLLPPVRARLARWWLRTMTLALVTVLIFGWRISLNGGHEPYFRYNSNRHAIEPLYTGSDTTHPRYVAPDKIVGPDVGVHGVYRAASIAWIWCHYFLACVSPSPLLSPDWSAGSIPLVTTLSPFGPRIDEFGEAHAAGDPRALVAAAILLAGALVVAYASGSFGFLRCLAANSVVPTTTTFAAAAAAAATSAPPHRQYTTPATAPPSATLLQTRPPILACVAFYVFPFLLASNLFVIVGTTVAERVAYLPSLGVCMAYGLLLNAPYDVWWLPVHELMPFISLPETESALLEEESTGDTSRDDKDDKDDVQKDDASVEPVASTSGANGRTPWQPSPRLLRKRTAFAQCGLLLLLVVAMTQRCLQRNFAWTNQVQLWGAAFEVNPASAHTRQNYGINLSINNGVQRAIEVLEGARRMPEVDRVDSDEIFPTLAMCLKAVGRWEEALEVLAEGWAIIDARAAAIARGVKIWHMHELIPEGENADLKRGRLLATQGTILTNLDLKEAAYCMAKAIRLAPGDALVVRLVSDLEEHIKGGIQKIQEFRQFQQRAATASSLEAEAAAATTHH